VVESGVGHAVEDAHTVAGAHRQIVPDVLVALAAVQDGFVAAPVQILGARRVVLNLRDRVVPELARRRTGDVLDPVPIAQVVYRVVDGAVALAALDDLHAGARRRGGAVCALVGPGFRLWLHRLGLGD